MSKQRYAVIECGGRQQTVTEGKPVDLNRIDTEVGKPYSFERVLVAHDGEKVRIGKPYLEDVSVLGEIMDHRLGPKIITFRFKRRANSRRKRGHRQQLTRVMVKEIEMAGAPQRMEPKTEEKHQVAATESKSASTTQTKKRVAKAPTKTRISRGSAQDGS